jgi:uncharacterized protein (DUF2147 family)
MTCLRTTTTLRTSAVALCLLAAALAAVSFMRTAAAADALGTWYTGDKESQVRIVNCGGALCGNLMWLKEPNDPATGRPKTDKNNADASKQSRPLLGVPIVLAMKPSGTGQWGGQVYNASDGKTYSGSFTLSGPECLACCASRKPGRACTEIGHFHFPGRSAA